MPTCTHVSQPGLAPYLFDSCESTPEPAKPVAPHDHAPPQRAGGETAPASGAVASTLSAVNHMIGPTIGAMVAGTGAGMLLGSSGAGAAAVCLTPPAFPVCAGAALLGGAAVFVGAELADGKPLEAIRPEEVVYHGAVSGAAGAALGAFTGPITSVGAMGKDLVLGAALGRGTAAGVSTARSDAPLDAAFGQLTSVSGWATDAAGASLGWGLGVAGKLLGHATGQAGPLLRKASTRLRDEIGVPPPPEPALDNLVHLDDFRGPKLPPKSPESPNAAVPHAFEHKLAVGQSFTPADASPSSLSSGAPVFEAARKKGRRPGGMRPSDPSTPTPGSSSTQGAGAGRNATRATGASGKAPLIPPKLMAELRAASETFDAAHVEGKEILQMVSKEAGALRRDLENGTASWPGARDRMDQVTRRLEIASATLQRLHKEYVVDTLQALQAASPEVKQALDKAMKEPLEQMREFSDYEAARLQVARDNFDEIKKVMSEARHQLGGDFEYAMSLPQNRQAWARLNEQLIQQIDALHSFHEGNGVGVEAAANALQDFMRGLDAPARPSTRAIDAPHAAASRDVVLPSHIRQSLKTFVASALRANPGAHLVRELAASTRAVESFKKKLQTADVESLPSLTEEARSLTTRHLGLVSNHNELHLGMVDGLAEILGESRPGSRAELSRRVREIRALVENQAGQDMLGGKFQELSEMATRRVAAGPTDAVGRALQDASHGSQYADKLRQLLDAALDLAKPVPQAVEAFVERLQNGK